jgi:hypothetical protein
VCSRKKLLTRADTEQHLCCHHTGYACSDKPSRAVFVEYGTNVDATEEGQEGVQGENPSDAALAVSHQLVCRYVRLENGNGIRDTQSSETVDGNQL